MGYTTDFSGNFQLNKPLTKEHSEYLTKFSDTRRMKRNAKLIEKRSDPLRKAVGLPVGIDGGYFVNEEGFCGQGLDFKTHPEDIIDYNSPPKDQPGLWCQWVPTADNEGIEWNGGEKFYQYVEWLDYLIKNFLKPWGYVLKGEVEWFGEEADDRGLIIVKKNVVKTKIAKITYE